MFPGLLFLLFTSAPADRFERIFVAAQACRQALDQLPAGAFAGTSNSGRYFSADWGGKPSIHLTWMEESSTQNSLYINMVRKTDALKVGERDRALNRNLLDTIARITSLYDYALAHDLIGARPFLKVVAKDLRNKALIQAIEKLGFNRVGDSNDYQLLLDLAHLRAAHTR